MKAEDCIRHVILHTMKDCIWEPPSVVLKREFDRLAKTMKPTDLPVDHEAVESCARQTLLTKKEVKMWFEHLGEVKESRSNKGS